MKILQVTSARTYGGGERHVVDLARGIAGRGHDVFVAVRPTSVWKDRLSFLPANHLFEVSIRNSFGVLSAMRIAEFARENQIDVIHAHVARDYIPASIACMAARDARFVLTRHVLFPLKPFNRFALKNVDRAIGVSAAAAATLERIFPIEKIAVVPNGLDIDSLSADEAKRMRNEFRELHDIPQTSYLVGTLGELKEKKGQTDLILAARPIAEKVPNAMFVVVGEDHSGGNYRRELRRLVSVFGLKERFLWLDWLEDTASFYSAIDLFVSPSHSESFGLAILEAMSHGVPIVATETEGAKLLLEDIGRFANIGDPVDLAKAVIAVSKESNAAEMMGEPGRQAAAAKFSLEKMIDSTENIYKEVVAGKRRSA